MTLTKSTLCGFFTVLLAASTLSGCVIDSRDEASMAMSWILVDDRGVRTTCTEVGATTVRLDLLNLDSEEKYSFDFECRAKSGRTTAIAPGEYRVSVSLITGDGVVLSGLDLTKTIFVYRDGVADIGLIEFEAYPADQFFQLDWTIAQQGSGMPLSCTAAGATTVELSTTLPGQAPVLYDFDCAVGEGRTTTVAPGTYDLKVDLLSPSAKVLSTASMGGVRVLEGHPVQLPSIIFDVVL